MIESSKYGLRRAAFILGCVSATALVGCGVGSMNPTQPIGRAIVWLGSMVLAAALLLSPSAFAGTVFGPISGGTHGWPFGSPGSSVDLAAHGYVEAEFYIEGDALSYAKSGAWGRDGKWSASPSSSAPFRTRLLTLRPAALGAFNGTVVVEWLNVSSGFDIPEFFAADEPPSS